MPVPHYNLANSLRLQGKLDAAAESYAHALVIRPDFAEAHNNLGLTCMQLGRHAEALTHFQRAIGCRPDFAEAYNNLASVYKKLDRLEDVLASCEKALSIDPRLVEIGINLGYSYLKYGDAHKAVAAFDRALSVAPDHIDARLGAALALPVIYDDAADVDSWRDRIGQRLRALSSELTLDTPEAVRAALQAFENHTNFTMHYQGRDDSALQGVYASMVHRVAHAAYPQYAKPAKRMAGKKIKVGYVSAHFYRHTILKLFHGWITKLDRARFETHVFHIGEKCDEQTQFLHDNCDHFFHFPRGGHDAVKRLHKSTLDVLIYPDVGMDAPTQILAALRLAPVQCVAWGHPVTTGLPNMDYFLSSDLMEPDESDGQYSEALVRLPNLSIAYDAPDVSVAEIPQDMARRAASPDGGGPNYLCTQSLFKILPQQDDLFARIAKRVGACRFWFIGHESAYVTRKMQERLGRAFAAHGLDAEAFVAFLPRLSKAEFLGAHRAADVVLDSVAWSGGNTALEGLAMNVPVVTLPGQMMRGRHSAAMLWRMGLDRLVAKDEDDYVEIAASLGADADIRKATSDAIADAKAVLYEDAAAIAGLEQFLEGAVAP